MLVAGCSMLVKDPIFNGDKDFPNYNAWNYNNLLYGPFRKIKKVKKFLISFPLKTGFPLRYSKHPETSIQYPVSLCLKH
jgi:hypothetical protein